LESTLSALTRARGAKISEFSGWQMPAHYGDTNAEIRAVHQTAVLHDASHWGRLLICGADHLGFLHRMTTNHFESLEPGSGLRAVFPDNRSRILDLGTFYRRSDATLVVLSPQAAASILPWLDRYLFAEKVELREVTDESAMIELAGPEAVRIAMENLDIDLSSVPPDHLLKSSADLWLARLDRCSHPGLRAAGNPDVIGELWEKLEEAGAHPAGEEAWEILRIEDGLPAFGRELTDEHNPWEAGLDDTIHMNKGCYIGQEVIARLDSYDKVKQHLVGLRWTEGHLPPPNTELTVDGKAVGRATSAVHSPHLNQNIGLAYVRRAHCESGTRLAFTIDDLEQVVEVTALPFSPGA
jgi:tRNA-modifying protein YgfZ